MANFSVLEISLLVLTSLMPVFYLVSMYFIRKQKKTVFNAIYVIWGLGFIYSVTRAGV